MSHEKLISVIVPVYNTEPYLRKCLDSITQQTYKNLEIILIDDGSTDGSGDICDEFAKKDDRVIVVHKNNAGLSAARNDGIKLANSPYLTFVDSDDYIELDTYESVVEGIRLYDPDLTFFREKTVDLNGRTIYVHGESPTEKIQYKNKDFAEDRIIAQQINGMCDKVYRASILKHLRFEEGKVHGEDFLYNILALREVERVVFVDQIKYSYVTNPDSVTRRNFSPKVFDQIYFKDQIALVVSQLFPQYTELCDKRAFLARLHVCRPIYKEHKENECKEELKQINDYLKENRNNVSLSTVEAVEYWLYSHSKLLYRPFLAIVSLRKH